MKSYNKSGRVNPLNPDYENPPRNLSGDTEHIRSYFYEVFFEHFFEIL